MGKLFAKVETEAYYADLLFNSWDDLVLVLRAYGSGRIGSINKAYGNTISELPGDGGIYALMAGAYGVTGDAIVEKVLLPKFETWRKKRDHYYKCSESFDYDGGSRFHKTSVDVMDLGGGVYALGLHAAYVGRQPENTLAETLEIPQALWWAKASVTGSGVEDGYYRLPMDVVTERLSHVSQLPVFGTKDCIREIIDATGRDAFERPVLPLLDTGILSVALSFDSLAFEAPFKQLWERDGNDLFCPMRLCTYADEIKQYGKFRFPVWDVSVRASKKTSDRYPLWKAKDVESALLLVEEITTALEGA